MMELSACEILLLSILFIIPQALIFFVAYVMFYFIAIKRDIPKVRVFYAVDILMPFCAAFLWAVFQSKAHANKSFGNLVEISYMGVFWGLLFVYRCWCMIALRRYRMGLLVGIECVVVVLLTVFMPTLAE